MQIASVFPPHFPAIWPLTAHHSGRAYWRQCSLGPGASYLLHLGLWVSAFPTILAPAGRDRHTKQPVFGARSHQRSSFASSLGRRHCTQAGTAHSVQSRVWPEWHFQRYPVKVITLNLKIHAPRHSVTIREQQAERQSRGGSQSMFQKRAEPSPVIRNPLTPGHALWWHPIPNINRGLLQRMPCLHGWESGQLSSLQQGPQLRSRSVAALALCCC